MRAIGTLLRPRKEKVDRKAFRFADLQPITIHFDGSVEKRKVDGNREYSMDLWFARPGDIVVAKIDLKNGAVAIVPNDWEDVAVTGHFAVYEPDCTALLPAFLHRTIQTSFFKAHLWRNKVGAEGRKEVKLDFFEAQRIPCPPLGVQQALAERETHAQEQVASLRRRADEIMAKADTRFYKDLALAVPTMHDLPKILAVSWTRLIRWGMSYNQHAQTAIDLTQGKYPVVDLGSVLTLVQYGTSQKANTVGKGAPIVRMNNIKDGRLNLGDLKHIELSAKECSKLLLEHDDILINRTNSKELVGKCAVFHEEAEYVFASYLIRLRTDSAQADPQFVSYTLNSGLGRQQIDAVSRQIIGQANINTEEIRALQIPLPRVTTQRRIMERVQEGRAKADALRTEADELSAQATTEVEEMILGVRPVK